MRYDDRYTHHDEDDLWDDELELSTDDRHTTPDDESPYQYTSDSHYAPYQPPYDDNAEQAAPPDNSDHDYYSEPEPEPEPKPSRSRGFFRRRKEEDKTEDDDDEDDDDDDDDDDDNDYYDSDAQSGSRRRKRKTPKLDPEDPDYWISDEDDSPLSGIMPSSGSTWKWKLAAAVGVIVILIGVWGWFLRPYADSAVKYGYISNMERRGSIFKTFEGTMIPYKELGDPNPLYFQQLPFSVSSDSLAAHIKRMMLGCVPVRVEYETYRSPLPWKGEQKMVVVKADTADTRKILPPEYRNKDK